jgi:hypothetical protein
LNAIRGFLAVLAFAGLGLANAEDVASPAPAAVLQARYAAFKDQRVEGRFHRPLRIESREGKDDIAGEIHALVDSPFAVTAAALKDPSHWCEILLLHLDTKDCHASSDGNATFLRVGVVTHYDQPASAAFTATFTYRLAEETATFLHVALDAATGPVGTSNYLIDLEAMPAEGGRTFIRMSYSYSYGVMAKIAMMAYFATFGRNKFGFTEVGTEKDGQPRYITGMRGVVERNTMRYYLAVEAYLGTLSLPPEARVEQSLRNWYAAVEHYPLQLHEMEEGEYLAMKRREFADQKSQS